MKIVREVSPEYRLQTREFYLEKFGRDHRYDPRAVVTLKRLLQRELPESTRHTAVQELFAEYVTEDETAFACELYLSLDQISCMRRHGMHIGNHGYAHSWLNHLSPEAQAVEVDRSLGIPEKIWHCCGRLDHLLIPMGASMIRSSKSCAVAIAGWGLASRHGWPVLIWITG